jgi:hypothetical protein
MHQIGVGNDSEIPTAYNLGQNYPNPFNPSTKIDYSIAIAGEVNISIYSIAGELITNLVNEYQPAGRYSIVFNASNVASGVYLYKITSGSFSLAKKLVVLK